jgi:hypothetical protein
MEHEGEKWIFFIADFHILVLFMAKKHDLSEKKMFRLSRAIAVERKTCAALTG